VYLTLSPEQPCFPRKESSAKEFSTGGAGPQLSSKTQRPAAGVTEAVSALKVEVIGADDVELLGVVDGVDAAI